ncbi:hypothetical protein GBA52_015372 [Prunus armeniaca]|nr:hypothetical protein GBA52_015372 [Prunus armeniaca]
MSLTPAKKALPGESQSAALPLLPLSKVGKAYSLSDFDLIADLASKLEVKALPSINAGEVSTSEAN